MLVRTTPFSWIFHSYFYIQPHTHTTHSAHGPQITTGNLFRERLKKKKEFKLLYARFETYVGWDRQLRCWEQTHLESRCCAICKMGERCNLRFTYTPWPGAKLVVCADSVVAPRVDAMVGGAVPGVLDPGVTGSDVALVSMPSVTIVRAAAGAADVAVTRAAAGHCTSFSDDVHRFFLLVINSFGILLTRAHFFEAALYLRNQGREACQTMLTHMHAYCMAHNTSKTAGKRSFA